MPAPAAPQPPGRDPAGEAAALARIADLAAALPGRPPQPRTPVWQVRAGDIIGHPGYRLQPFLVAVPPRDRDGQIEITGRLTDRSDGDPAGQITLALPQGRAPGPGSCLPDTGPGPVTAPAPRRGHHRRPGHRPGPRQRPVQSLRAAPSRLPCPPGRATPHLVPGTSMTLPSRRGPSQPDRRTSCRQNSPPARCRRRNLLPQPGPARPRSSPGRRAGNPARRRPQTSPDGRAADHSADDVRLLRDLDHVWTRSLNASARKQHRLAPTAPPSPTSARPSPCCAAPLTSRPRQQRQRHTAGPRGP